MQLAKKKMARTKVSIMLAICGFLLLLAGTFLAKGTENLYWGIIALIGIIILGISIFIEKRHPKNTKK